MEVNLPFRGYALNAVDAKGRVSVPAPFRDLIAKRCRTYAPGDSSVDEKQLDIAIHPDFDRLVAYDEIGTRTLSSALRESVSDVAAAERSDALADKGRIVGATTPASFDSAGRLVLPPMLREFAGIGEHALFWGNIEFFEIWDPAKAQAAFADNKLYSATLAYLMREKGLK